MRILLDTHVFLWFIGGDKRIPLGWIDAITDEDNQVYLSVASIWEATAKYQLGKMFLPEPASSYFPRNRVRHGIGALPIEGEDAVFLGTLPSYHRDPFDRMIICQAIRNGLVLATVDTDILKYPVTVLP